MTHFLVMTAVCAAVALVAEDPTAFVWLVLVEFLSAAHHAERHHPDTWLGRASGASMLAIPIAGIAAVIIGKVVGFEPRGSDGTVALLGAMLFTQALSYCWHRYQHDRRPSWLVGIAASIPGIATTALLVRWWSN